MLSAQRQARQGERRRRESDGRLAEDIASLWLRARGYRILRRRLRTPVGEIDVLAQRGDVLAVIEVKTRKTHHEALASLTPRQRRRIVRAAMWYVARMPATAGLHIRFDLMVVRPLRLPAHIENAWTPESEGI